jgi:hypothetical protein
MWDLPGALLSGVVLILLEARSLLNRKPNPRSR